MMDQEHGCLQQVGLFPQIFMVIMQDCGSKVHRNRIKNSIDFYVSNYKLYIYINITELLSGEVYTPIHIVLECFFLYLTFLFFSHNINIYFSFLLYTELTDHCLAYNL